MAAKATGKYYAKVYRAKKIPAHVKRNRTIRHILLWSAAAAVIVVGIIVWQSARASRASFMEVSASRQALANVDVYPRVVNHDAPMEQTYVPDCLVSLNTVPNGESVYLRADAAEAFMQMVDAMSADGLGLLPVSGYLSYEQQSEARQLGRDRFIARGMTEEEADAMIAAYYPMPGEDEAQLGTCVDVSTDVQSVEQFSQTEQCRWIAAHACEYGFVVRYPGAKKSVTGVMAKPWHLRYVGVEAAVYMTRTGLCLEEYAAAVRQDNPDAAEEGAPAADAQA